VGRWEPNTWQDYQEVYSRLQKLDANRLNVSSWLGGLTLAAFAALTASSTFQFSSLGFSRTIPFIIACSLGIATLIFLATAYGAYHSIRLVGHLSRKNVMNLEDDKADQVKALGDLKAKKEPKEPDAWMSDEDQLRKAWDIHENADGLVTTGLLFVGLALIGISVLINIWVFVITFVCLLFIVARSPSVISLVLESRKRKGERAEPA